MKLTSILPRAILEHGGDHNPAVISEARKRASNARTRIADAVIMIAGSMTFVFVQLALFVLWLPLFERSPWPALVVFLSMESVLLTSFVLIAQNRQAALSQTVADHAAVANRREAQREGELSEKVDALVLRVEELTAALRER